MSRNISDSCAMVVDMSKKCKNENYASPSWFSNQDIYSVVDKTTKSKLMPATSDDGTYNTCNREIKSHVKEVREGYTIPIYAQLEQVPQKLQFLPTERVIKKNCNDSKCYNSSSGNKNSENVMVCDNHCNTSKCLLACFFLLITSFVAIILAIIVVFVLITNLQSDILLQANSSTMTSLQHNTVRNYSEYQLNNLSIFINNFTNVITNRLSSLEEKVNNNITQLDTALSTLSSETDFLKNEKQNLYKDASLLSEYSNAYFQENFKFTSSNITYLTENFSDLNWTKNRIDEMINTLTSQLTNALQHTAAFNTCADILTLSLSLITGTYNIRSPDGSIEPTNCVFSCNGMTGNWRRIAYLNAQDMRNFACPQWLQRRTDSLSCRHNKTIDGCTSVFYPTNNYSYTHICGRIRGSLSGSPDGFQYFGGKRRVGVTLEQNYVDGVSLTYGNPRNHIWTLTASVNFRQDTDKCVVCQRQKPDYVSSHYSCELVDSCQHSICYVNSLWDGDQCVGNGTFYRQLSQPTREDIEMRVCRAQSRYDEDILITFVEIFVL